MKTKYNIRRGFTLVELLVVISIIATLAGVGVPVVLGKMKEGDRAQATANIKSIGLALFSFEQEYGFPSPSSVTAVQESNPDSTITMDTSSSNGYFRQLLVGGFIDSETSFYAKAPYTKKSDGDMSAGKALAAGEVGFAYIMESSTAALSSSGNSGRPIIAAAVYNGASDGTFDPDVYTRQAVVLKMDQSATSLRIRPNDKRVVVGSGKTLLQTGIDTVWGNGASPIIQAPLKK